MTRGMVAMAMFVAMVSAPVAGQAFSPCTLTGNPASYVELTVAQIEALLGQAMACYPAGAPFTNQEYHSGGAGSAAGNIVDYKKGPSDPVDPTSQIGTYSITTTTGRGSHAIIVYTYPGNPTTSDTYAVFGPEPASTNLYDFCVGPTPLPGGPVRVVPTGGAPAHC